MHSKLGPKPCSECPFRKTAPPGYIGGHSDPAEITTIVFEYDQKFPCHLDVNRLHHDDALPDDHGGLLDLDDPIELAIATELAGGMSYEDACREARQCVGSLICMNNSGKLSRDPAVARKQKELGKSDEVFANRHEFVEYHRNFQESLRKHLDSLKSEPAEPAQSAVKGVRRAKRAARQKRNEIEGGPDNPRPPKRTSKPKGKRVTRARRGDRPGR